MRRSASICTIGGVLLLLAACASTPDVTVAYYLPKGRLDATVSRLVNCDTDNNPLVTTTVTGKLVYTASDRVTFNLDAPDHFYADSDVAFTLTEDGRLTSINQNTAGQGSAIVKSAVAFGLAAAALDSKSEAQAAREGACKWLKKQAQDKGMTVNLFLSEDFASSVTKKEIPAAPDSRTAYTNLQPLIGKICITATLVDDPNQDDHRRASYVPGAFDDVVDLKLRQPAGYDVRILQQGDGGEECAVEIWKEVVYVPQKGKDFDLPIPKAALFGNQAFKLTLSDSGQITNIEYSHTSGTSAALDAGQAVAAPLKRDTPSDVAADLKAQADEMAQRARLQKCQQDPTNCS
jgi:hypothetical protein